MTLTDIFNKYKSDKGSLGHGDEIHNYGLVYEQFFEGIRDNEISLLEIGILNGASLKSWRRYFPNGEIFGVDNRTNYGFIPEDELSAINTSSVLNIFDINKPNSLLIPSS